MSSRSRNRSWLVIIDWNRFCDNDAPRLRSSWMRPRVGVLSWHSNSSSSLLLVPTKFFCFLFGSSRTARHLLVRALPDSSIRIHCIPSAAWDTRVEVKFLVKVKFSSKVHFSFGACLLSIHLLATLPLRGRVFPPYIPLCSSVEEVVMMSSRHTTIVELGDCCRLS